MNSDSTRYHVSDGGALTAAEIARLDAIEACEGDGVDSPEISDAAWANSVRGKHANIEAISIQLDSDVLAWLRAKGPGYHREVSRILRERMIQES